MAKPPIPPGKPGNIPPPLKLGSNRWKASCRFRKLNGEFVRVIRIRETSREARTALDDAVDELKREVEAHTSLRPVDTVNTAADLWIERVERDQRGTTHETYSRLLELHLRPALGALRLREVSVPAVQAMFDKLKANGLSPSTRRTVKTVALGVFETAVSHGAIADNPAKKIGKIRADARKAPRSLTPQERTDFVTKLSALASTPVEKEGRNGRTYVNFGCDPELPDLVTFMLGTGVRIGECLGVRWGDFAVAEIVDGEGATRKVPVVNITGNLVRVKGQGLIRHEGKTETARRAIPLPRFVTDMLARRRNEHITDGMPVFCSSTLGYRDARNTSRSLRAARTEVGYEWVHSHVFRKTAASEWYRMGLDDRAVSDLMGHAHISMTQDVYAGRKQLHAAGADAQDAAWLGS